MRYGRDRLGRVAAVGLAAAGLAAGMAAGLAAGGAALAQVGGAEARSATPRALILTLPGGAPVPDLDALAALARGHDLVVLGEIHDNPRHHALQAELVRRLAPTGLAYEMLKSTDAPALAALRRSGAPEAELRAAAEAGGWAAYLPSMLAAPDAPIAGAGLSRDMLRLAIGDSAAAAIGPALREAGEPGEAGAVYGLDAPPDAAAQAQVEAEMAEAHCGALPEAMLPGMAEAQRLRDAAFAAALLRARRAGLALMGAQDAPRGGARAGSSPAGHAGGVERGGGDGTGDGAGSGREQAAPARVSAGPAVLVTGDGHARRDRGVPAYLGRAAPGLATLSVAMVEWPDGVSFDADGSGPDGSEPDWRAALAPWAPEGGPAEAAPFDIVVITARAEREDPCAGFATPAQD
ncbi:Uncharacterized iron-regulated protein [Albimonas donghaensis]|uniref:Uncharacterized iron-regulated protein n=1 Tax=Albimonas donghaensis TaxID=356660 RepID=A0A1H2S8W8_9RHOB|nr:ChaN family lipoprotein [Albimonas donghaensis]SDW28113.1 Uncharacterized iron-regulated protein [Albimonas donghaensis]